MFVAQVSSSYHILSLRDWICSRITANWLQSIIIFAGCRVDLDTFLAWLCHRRVFLLLVGFSKVFVIVCVGFRWRTVWCGSLMTRLVSLGRLCRVNTHAQTHTHTRTPTGTFCCDKSLMGFFRKKYY